jgi:hypothetical protein
MFLLALLGLILSILLVAWLFSAYWGSRGYNKFNKNQINLTEKPFFLINSKKVNKYTIENSYICTVSDGVIIGAFTRMYLFVKAILGFDIAPTIFKIEEGIRFRLLHRLKDYLSEFRIVIQKVGGGAYYGFASAMAIKLFPDSFNIFEFADSKKIIDSKKSRIALLTLIHSIIVVGAVAWVFSSSTASLVKDVALNIDSHMQKVIWTNIGESYLAEAIDPIQNSGLINKVNNLYLSIPKGPQMQDLDYEAIIVDRQYKDIFMLPDGKMIVTKALVDNIADENMLTYLMAHDVEHLADRSLFIAMGYKMVDIYCINWLFGANSTIAKYLMKLYSFENTVYPDDEEDNSDDYAAIVLDYKYGSILGIKEAIDMFMKDENIDKHYYNRHRLVVSMDEYFRTLLLAHRFDLQGNEVPFVYDKRALKKPQDAAAASKGAQAVGNATDFQGKEDEFNHVIEALTMEYGQAIKNGRFALEFKDATISDDVLNQRLSDVAKAKALIATYRDKMDVTIIKYDHSINQLLNNSTDSDKEFKRLDWNKALKQLRLKIDNQFSIDAQVLDQNEVALQYLAKRLGAFSLVNGEVVFSNPVAQGYYLEIINKKINSENQQ